MSTELHVTHVTVYDERPEEMPETPLDGPDCRYFKVTANKGEAVWIVQTGIHLMEQEKSAEAIQAEVEQCALEQIRRGLAP